MSYTVVLCCLKILILEGCLRKKQDAWTHLNIGNVSLDDIQ